MGVFSTAGYFFGKKYSLERRVPPVIVSKVWEEDISESDPDGKGKLYPYKYYEGGRVDREPVPAPSLINETNRTVNIPKKRGVEAGKEEK